jgi:hypothetical protein
LQEENRGLQLAPGVIQAKAEQKRNFDSKIVPQADSLVNRLEVDTSIVNCNYQYANVSLHNVPTIINGQVLATVNSIPKNEKSVVSSNVPTNQPKDYKIIYKMITKEEGVRK